MVDVTIPGLVLAVCGEAIWAKTSVAAYFSPETGVLTVVGFCLPNDLLSAKVTINGVRLLTQAVLYPNLPAEIGVWSGPYPPNNVPVRVPELHHVPGLPYPVPFHSQPQATFRDNVMSLGDDIRLYPNIVTEIILAI